MQGPNDVCKRRIPFLFLKIVAAIGDIFSRLLTHSHSESSLPPELLREQTEELDKPAKNQKQNPQHPKLENFISLSKARLISLQIKLNLHVLSSLRAPFQTLFALLFFLTITRIPLRHFDNDPFRVLDQSVCNCSSSFQCRLLAGIFKCFCSLEFPPFVWNGTKFAMIRIAFRLVKHLLWQIKDSIFRQYERT